MTYPLNGDLHEAIDDAVEAILGELEEAFANVRRYRGEHVVHREEVDLHDLLGRHHCIDHVWGTEDVRQRRPDLDEEQAWEVLQAVERRLDSEHGVTWDIVEGTAEELYPKTVPGRAVRLARAAEIIAAYGDGDERDNLVDLLADCMHFCQEFGEPFAEFCGTAQLHFHEETKTTTHKKGIPS